MTGWSATTTDPGGGGMCSAGKRRARPRIHLAAKTIENWAREEESRILEADSTREAEGHRLASEALWRCVEHLRSHPSCEGTPDGLREELKALADDANCTEEFLRKVTHWEGSSEDDLNEAMEAAQRLCLGLADQEVSGELSQEVESNRPPACAPPTSSEGSAVEGEGKG